MHSYHLQSLPTPGLSGLCSHLLVQDQQMDFFQFCQNFSIALYTMESTHLNPLKWFN